MEIDWQKEYATMKESRDYWNAAAIRENDAWVAERNTLHETRRALEACVAVLTDSRVGTINHDAPDWYAALNKAVAQARAVLPDQPKS